MKKNVAIGFLGVNLDSGRGTRRWERWRPSVDLCRQDHMIIDRFEILLDRKHIGIGKQVKSDIELISPETEVVLNEVNIDNPWELEEVYSALFDFVDVYDFDPENESYLLHITTGTHVAQICLFLLNEAHYLPGKILQLSPPKSRHSQEVGQVSIIDLDLSKYDAIADRFQQESQSDTSFLKSGIPTRNAAFNAMIDEIEQVAIRSKAPVLLQGPTGAGKSRLARRIFELKKRRHQVQGPLVEINCATLRGDAAMSSLFGHKRGAWAGATKDRAGLLRAANDGVLFLDEIEELGLDEQAMILQVLEDQKFYPVGGDQQVRSRFQLIVGTTADLTLAVSEGRFREDLLARINLWSYALPGLCDRREDIAPNLEFELAKYSAAHHRNLRFNKEAKQAYLKFALRGESRWAANFRDLSASVARLCTFASGARIDLPNVEREIARLLESWRRSAPSTHDQKLLRLLAPEQLAQIDEFERPALAHVIEVCQASNSLSSAGRKLFAVSRLQRKSTNDADRLKKYLARFGLSWHKLALSA
jgi:transcriptional regulatory protein RtcR